MVTCPNPEGQRHIGYLGFLYEESQLWFLVETLYLGIWTLRETVSRTEAVYSMQYIYNSIHDSGGWQLQTAPRSASERARAKGGFPSLHNVAYAQELSYLYSGLLFLGPYILPISSRTEEPTI